MAGYIRKHRSILEWEWYHDINTYYLFDHLLLTVNYKESRYQGYEIPAGSRVIGLKALSAQIPLSIQQIRTALKKLEKSGEITIKTTNKFSIISITNWEKYQADNKQVTNKQQTNNKQITTSKKGKKDNTINSIINKGSEIDFLDASIWKDFVEHRKQLKKPMTEKAAEMMINKLRAFHVDGEDPNACLKQSIEQGWQGVFEIKQKGTDHGKKSSKYQRARDAIRRSNEKLGIS